MSSSPGGAGHAILFDSTLCIGCGACALACKERNHLPRTAEQPLADELSARTYSVVKQHGRAFARHMCMHCEVPTCASVCLVGALRKTSAGPVAYEESRCIGCRYCMQACPFMVPRYEWDKVFPRVRKCDMCGDRLAAGQKTACSSACPTGATKCGPRHDLVEEARARVEKEPNVYVNHVYGVEEVGGTSVLLLSGVPFEQLGYPTDLPHQPLPQLTWEVMSKVPRFAVTASVFLGGLYWITKRREHVSVEEHGGEDRP